MTDQSAHATAYVLQEMSDHVLWLTLNRPEQRNPLSSGMIAAIKDAIEMANDNPQVRAVVLTGAGPVFSAGHDLKEMSELAVGSNLAHEEHLREILSRCAKMMLAIMHSPKAMIACVQGTATAAGCQLVSACDLAIASDAVHFCTPGVNIGNFCTTPLVGIGRNMHRKHAMELALTGDMLSAEDAFRFGLVNRIVPAAKLRQVTEELAKKIALKSAQGIRSGKQAYYRQMDMTIEEAFEYTTEVMIQGTLSQDSAEGTKAFFEKREPEWGDA
ncbi:MAG: enoyl-CoA hydratase [Pseudomonadales bacterium]